MLQEYQIIFMRIREHFRKNKQTNWGKNQLINLMDDMEEQIRLEKETENINPDEVAL